MNWKNPEDELPKGKPHTAIRCLAKIWCEKECGRWSGFADVYFRCDQGWKRCENEANDFSVIQWIYIEEMGED